MSSVVDIRVRNTKKTEKDFKDRYTSVSFPDAADILSDQIAEQMMMDGFVSSALFCRMRIFVWHVPSIILQIFG
jgi:hypothetical protein